MYYRPSIGLPDGDHPSLAPSTELSAHEPGVLTRGSQSPPTAHFYVPLRSCEGTDESMSLGDSDRYMFSHGCANHVPYISS